MKTQIIPEVMFRHMVQGVPFADMVRLEDFNKNKKTHVFLCIMVGALLTPLVFLMPNLLWACIWSAFNFLVVVCGILIGLKENSIHYSFQTMCQKIRSMEELFEVDRNGDLSDILDSVQRNLVNIARQVLEAERSFKEMGVVTDIGVLRRKFFLGFEIAKSVLGNHLDGGRGYQPFFERAKEQVVQ